MLPHLKSWIKQLLPALHLEGCAIHPTLCICGLSMHLHSEMSMLHQVNHANHSMLWQIRTIRRVHHHLDEASCLDCASIGNIQAGLCQLSAGGPGTECGSLLGLQDSAEDSHYSGAQTAGLVPSTLLYQVQACYPGPLHT